MIADIDREKLRELCERATPGPWRWWTSCSWRRLSSDARGNDRNGKPLDRDGGVICPYVCRDGHPDLIITEEDADFVAASRTALPALLDLTDAQAAKIAELEAENARRSAELDERRTECRLANKIATQERRANAAAQVLIASLESERDQLRKQVEGPSIILSPAEIQSGLDRVRWAELLICQLPANHDGRNSWLLNYGSSTASALEQKEQG